jgi:hypothetical protein
MGSARAEHDGDERLVVLAHELLGDGERLPEDMNCPIVATGSKTLPRFVEVVPDVRGRLCGIADSGLFNRVAHRRLV